MVLKRNENGRFVIIVTEVHMPPDKVDNLVLHSAYDSMTKHTHPDSGRTFDRACTVWVFKKEHPIDKIA